MPLSRAWDQTPLFGWLQTRPATPGVPGVPVVGDIVVTIGQRIRRQDGRMIYPGGVITTVRIGNLDQQDPAARAEVRSAMRAQAEAEQGDAFDGTAWDLEWDEALASAFFTYVHLSDDPDVTPNGWQVKVEERLQGGRGATHIITPLSSSLLTPVPGINIGDLEVPEGSPTAPAPSWAKGQPGGLAALDADGDVLNAAGEKLLPGGGGLDDSAVADLVTDEGSATREALDGLLGEKADASALAAVATTGAYADLTGTPAIPTTPGDVGADPAGTAATLVGAITPEGIGAKAGNWQPAAADVSDSTATGRDLLTAADAAAARSAIGAAQTLDQALVLEGFGPTPPDPTGLPDGRVWFLTPED